MSPPPHSPRWRPGPHPGVGGRGTGLGPHHHHKGLHHPTHSQRRPGTWKGQRGCEGDVTGVGQGGDVPEPAKLKKPGPYTLLGNQTKRKGGQEGRQQQSSQSQSQKDQGPQLPRDSFPNPFTSQALPPQRENLLQIRLLQKIF